MNHFYGLKVIDVIKETEDTVSVAFEVPSDLQGKFQYVSGQHLTVKFDVNGVEERRSYSMCSSPSSGEAIRVAVKRVENGKVSNLINDTIKVGDEVMVMPPQGNFILPPEKGNTYVAFAVGSGITPIWSMIKSVVKNDPQGKFVLFYGNRSRETAIFKNEIDALVNDQFEVVHVFSREDSGSPLTNGRIDMVKAIQLLESKSLLDADAFYMCGPEQMVYNVKEALSSLGINENKVHFELFTTPVLMAKEEKVDYSDFSGMATVKVIYDDEEIEFELSTDGENVLDAAMKLDVDVPFSCKGAVCCTCKAKVTEGRMVMDANYALSDEEVEEGFVLTCQAHPATEHVTVDYDEA